MLEVVFERDASEIRALLTGLVGLGGTGHADPCRFTPVRTNDVDAKHRSWDLTPDDEAWAPVDPDWWDVVDCKQDRKPVTSHMRGKAEAFTLAGALNWAALGAHTRERFVAVWCHPDLYPTQEGDIEPEELRWSVVDGETGLTIPNHGFGDEATMRALAGILNCALRTHPQDQPSKAFVTLEGRAFISIPSWDWSSPIMDKEVTGELALALGWLFDTSPPPPWVLVHAPGPQAAACATACARGVDSGPCLKGCSLVKEGALA